jgi:hypothetical protein
MQKTKKEIQLLIITILNSYEANRLLLKYDSTKNIEEILKMYDDIWEWFYAKK